MSTDYKPGGKAADIIKNITGSGRLPHAFIIEGGGDEAAELAKYLSAFAVCSEQDKPGTRCKNKRYQNVDFGVMLHKSIRS